MFRIGYLLVPALLLAFAAACGDDDDNGGAAPTATAASPTVSAPRGIPTETPVPEPVPEENRFPVEATSFAFDPSEFTVAAGEPVEFLFANDSGTRHTFTVYRDEEYENQMGSVGDDGATSAVLRLVFDEPGTYYFRCEFHPDRMQGTIEAE